MYRLGLLRESDEAECRLHLETCAACREALAFIDNGKGATAGEPVTSGPTSFNPGLHIGAVAC